MCKILSTITDCSTYVPVLVPEMLVSVVIVEATLAKVGRQQKIYSKKILAMYIYIYIM